MTHTGSYLTGAFGSVRPTLLSVSLGVLFVLWTRRQADIRWYARTKLKTPWYVYT